MTRASLSLGMVFLLFGCGGPVIEERVKTVPVPVAIQPIRAEQVPQPVTPLPARPRSDAAASDLLLAKVCELYSYMVVAHPLLLLSAGARQSAVPDYPECRATKSPRH